MALHVTRPNIYMGVGTREPNVEGSVTNPNVLSLNGNLRGKQVEIIEF